MNIRLREWRSIIVCCVPAITVAALVGIGVAGSSAVLGTFFSKPLGLSLIVAMLLVCPLQMGWMMWRMQKRSGSGTSSSMAAACCPPATQTPTVQGHTAKHLQALQAQREALEQEVAVLQQTRQH